MIIISTNNGKKFLSDLLFDLAQFECKIPIRVIDTQSSDLDSIEFLTQIKHLHPQLDLEVYKTPGRNFDSGAYMYAIQNISADRYYFLHDSIRIKTSNVFEEIDNKLSPGVVVALSVFSGNCYDNEEQRAFCRTNWDTTDFNVGIFGPMFAILREDIVRAWDNLPKVLPTSKNLQMAMERGWSVFCTKSGFNIVPLEEGRDHCDIFFDGYIHFKKFLPKRQ